MLLITTAFSLAVISGCADTVGTSPKIPDTGISQNDLVTISGVVEDQSNNKVAGANITVKEDTKVIARTTTNSKGEFSVKVPKVFGGSYFVEAQKIASDGTLEQTILVNAGQEANFTGEDSLKKTEVPAKPVPAV